MSTFNKLIEQRIKIGISQKDMALHLKCSKSALNMYEKGKRNISAEKQDMYADRLGYEIRLIVK